MEAVYSGVNEASCVAVSNIYSLDLILLQNVRVKPLLSGQSDFLALLSADCPGLGSPKVSTS